MQELIRRVALGLVLKDMRYQPAVGQLVLAYRVIGRITEGTFRVASGERVRHRRSKSRTASGSAVCNTAAATCRVARSVRSNILGMKFEVANESEDELGAPIDDVAQEAIDATAITFTSDAGIDVEQHLRAELASRGIRAADEESVAEIAHEIRSGHHVSVGRPDGSMEERAD